MAPLGFRRRTRSDGLLDRRSSFGAFRQMRWPQALIKNPGEVQRMADAEVVVMLRQPVPRGFSATVPKMRQKGPLGIELARNSEPEHCVLVVDRMDMHVTEALALEVFVVDDFPQEGERAQFLEQARIEGDLVQPVLDVPRCLRNIRAVKRIDLD